jgi:hypothetical protein
VGIRAGEYNDEVMPQDYDREVYQRNFARLLNRALKIGGGDPSKALEWLDKKYKLLRMVIFSRHRAEMSDAYMDVREHMVKRMKEGGGAEELE